MIIVIDYFFHIGMVRNKQVMLKTSGDSRDMVQAVFRMDCTIKDPLFGTPGKGRTVQTVEFEEVGIS